MMIRVEYKDGQQQLVRPHQLKKLISSEQIVRFERSGGWATLGVDVLRVPGGSESYTGVERRSP
ncbi:MAG: hypothetical protein RQ754_05045 [Desulfuromonadales bacterium]|jgi:hypothetical protein|nr:hypothetical protein [Desulfuromonadales bacterium]